MPYLADEHCPIPTTDLLTWMFEARAPYDADKAVSGTCVRARELARLTTNSYTSMPATRRDQYHVDKLDKLSAGLQQASIKLA